MIKAFSLIRKIIERFINQQLKKFGYIKIGEFTKPYIIRKKTEGVQFLFAITDSHSRLWYDLYSSDPVWPEMKFIKDNLVIPGSVIIECGSHHGCTAILLSNWVGPNGVIYAYEPGQKNFATLQENIDLNHIQKIKAINEVVGDSNKNVSFTEFISDSMGSMVTAGESTDKQDELKNTYTIKQVTLDHYLKERPTLIKVDTQGYIYQTLLGARNIIQAIKPNLALELDSKDATTLYGDNFEQILELIKFPEYEYFIQFESEIPIKIEFPDILTEWKKRNNFSHDIHLFARNNKL